MIMWAFPVLGCTLLASALLLRRRPLTALAVLLGGSVASMTLQSPVPGSTLQIVAACAAGLELCYIAATRTHRVSVTGVAMAGAGLLILLLGVPYSGQNRPGKLLSSAWSVSFSRSPHVPSRLMTVRIPAASISASIC